MKAFFCTWSPLRAKVSSLTPTFCWQNDSNVSSSTVYLENNFNLAVIYWNYAASVSLFWFCFSIMLDLFFIHHHASSKPNNHLQNCASKLLGSLCSHSKAEKHWNHSCWQNISIIELALALIIKSCYLRISGHSVL